MFHAWFTSQALELAGPNHTASARAVLVDEGAFSNVVIIDLYLASLEPSGRRHSKSRTSLRFVRTPRETLHINIASYLARSVKLK
jgi:hypothetical protein